MIIHLIMVTLLALWLVPLARHLKTITFLLSEGIIFLLQLINYSHADRSYKIPEEVVLNVPVSVTMVASLITIKKNILLSLSGDMMDRITFRQVAGLGSSLVSWLVIIFPTKNFSKTM